MPCGTGSKCAEPAGGPSVEIEVTVNAALAEDADGGGCGMRSLRGSLRTRARRWQGNSLDAHAGILQGDRGHFRRNIFGQIRDAEPIDRGRRAAAAAAAQDGLPLHKARGGAIEFVAGGICIRARPVAPIGVRIGSISRAGIDRDALSAGAIRGGDIFTPPHRAAPARKNVSVKRLRFVGALGFIFRPQRENLSRIGCGEKQFSARARWRSRLPGARWPSRVSRRCDCLRVPEPRRHFRFRGAAFRRGEVPSSRPHHPARSTVRRENHPAAIR